MELFAEGIERELKPNTVTKVWARWKGLAFNFDITPMDSFCPSNSEGLDMKDQGSDSSVSLIEKSITYTEETNNEDN